MAKKQTQKVTLRWVDSNGRRRQKTMSQAEFLAWYESQEEKAYNGEIIIKQDIIF